MPPKQKSKLSKSQKNLIQWKATLDIATDMVLRASDVASTAPTSVALDIEAYESNQALILEIGWSICDLSSGHLQNRFVNSRPDMFEYGKTVWASLQGAIAAFQHDLERAARRNKDERDMVQFDTQKMNAARVGDGTCKSCKTGLGKLLDEVDIKNYSLHNAGNDAHYTMELFLWLARNIGSQRV
ncbi:MAG: hypothetical protein J3R72DRAFT_487714 [Linnemannia gamsii]|nr:MAG: hypothetical protein J3R72DRAFT_487714 [Linnemannia gamsii]